MDNLDLPEDGWKLGILFFGSTLVFDLIFLVLAHITVAITDNGFFSEKGSLIVGGILTSYWAAAIWLGVKLISYKRTAALLGILLGLTPVSFLLIAILIIHLSKA